MLEQEFASLCLSVSQLTSDLAQAPWRTGVPSEEKLAAGQRHAGKEGQALIVYGFSCSKGLTGRTGLLIQRMAGCSARSLFRYFVADCV